MLNEAEAYAAPPGIKVTEIAAHTRQKRSPRLEVVLPENVPVEVVEHRLSEAVRECPICGKAMAEIGKKVWRTLKIIPAQVRIREDWYYTYACRTCRDEGTETPIATAEKAPALIPGSFASPEVVTHIMVQKYCMGVPLYRQEQEWSRQGVKLSRQTMSNWLLRCAEDWLKPVYDELHRQLRQRRVLHAEKFLEGFSGYLHADGYQGDHKLLENIRVVGCWVHVRRKFDEALNAIPPDRQEGSAALTGLQYCNKLFAWEKRFEGLSPEERRKQRLKEEKPILDALLSWSDSISGSVAPKSVLGKALHYLWEQWPYLARCLEDGRLELSNNRAERSIKPFVIGRKNFLFANSPLGAQSSAAIYSLIETAKENGLELYRYLLRLFTEAPAQARIDENWMLKLPPFC